MQLQKFFFCCRALAIVAPSQIFKKSVVCSAIKMFFFSLSFSFCLKAAARRITTPATILSPPAASPSAWWRHGDVAAVEERTGNNLEGRQDQSGRQSQQDETVSRRKRDAITSPGLGGWKQVKGSKSAARPPASQFSHHADLCSYIDHLYGFTARSSGGGGITSHLQDWSGSGSNHSPRPLNCFSVFFFFPRRD